MSYFFNNAYRFLIDDVEVSPVIGDEFGYEWEKDGNGLFFKKKLKGAVKFRGADYNSVAAATMETKFTFKVQKSGDGATWADDFEGFFYKTDCDFDDDGSILSVAVSTDDAYDDVDRVLNNEYNYIDLNPASINVEYKVRPMLQLITWVSAIVSEVDNANKITNNVGFTYWEEDLDRGYTEAEILAAGFTQLLDTSPFRGVNVYARYLTNLETFGGVATTDRPSNDLSATAPYFDKVSGEIYDTSGNEVILGGTQTGKTKWGLAPNCLAGDRYYIDFEANSPSWISIPINSSTAWGYYVDPSLPDNGCQSYWFKKTGEVFTYELDNSSDVTLKDGYELSSVIQLILAQENTVLHLNNTDYSEFLYGSADPIAGKDIVLALTPKSNIVNSYYSNPARKSTIRLNDILEMLKALYDVYWHLETVDDEKRLRIEHVSWYERGGSYGAQEVSVDLTTTIDARTQKSLAFDQNKYKYIKSKMPQRYEFSFDSDTGEYFNGNPINVLSGQISEGSIEKRDIQFIIPDIDTVAGKEGINLDGWALLDMELDAGVYSVKLEVIPAVNSISVNTQNGGLSFINLHPLYHRHGKPGDSLEINGEPTTALSITRNKQQPVEFVLENYDIDPLKLITTGLGSGQVDKMGLNLVSQKYTLTLNHDTE